MIYRRKAAHQTYFICDLLSRRIPRDAFFLAISCSEWAFFHCLRYFQKIPNDSIVFTFHRRLGCFQCATLSQNRLDAIKKTYHAKQAVSTDVRVAFPFEPHQLGCAAVLLAFAISNSGAMFISWREWITSPFELNLRIAWKGRKYRPLSVYHRPARLFLESRLFSPRIVSLISKCFSYFSLLFE